MFEFLELTRPAFGKPSPRSGLAKLRVSLSAQVALPTPLVVYDLPWCERPPEVSRYVADNLDALGVSVSGLRSEFHHTSDDEASSPPPIPLTICPYRPERYGLHLDDLLQARVIDIRLTPPRDAEGLPRYSAATMRRWDQRVARMADKAMNTFGAIESACWPPDVADVHKLKGKIDQLRKLVPQALICISLEAHRAGFEMPEVLSARPDIIALRADRWPTDQHAAFASIVRRTAERLENIKPYPIQLLVVPPAGIDELDIVKLFALGARLVAIDHWCRKLLQPDKVRQSAAEWAAANLGVITDTRDQEEDIDLSFLHQRIHKVRHWLESVGVAGVNALSPDYLASYSVPLPGVRSVINGVIPTG